MNSIVKIIIISALIAIAIAACSGKDSEKAKVQFAANDTTYLAITGMHCSGCAGAIKQSLELKKGVVSADVSFDSARAIVIYDHTKVTPDTMLAIVDFLGYSAEVK